MTRVDITANPSVLDGCLRMCRCLGGEHVHRCFRLVGEQDVFEGVCSEDRRLTKHALALYSDVEATRDQMIDVADRATR